jgi:hypothetical protein
MDTLGLVVGAAMVLAVAADASATLVTTQHHEGRWWPTAVFYRLAWRGFAAFARIARRQTARDRALGAFGPLSLIGLLMVWVSMALVGWSLIWWALRDSMLGLNSWVEAVYFAGVGFLTIGFGDILPASDLTRLLSVLEALMGVVTVALVIGFLPTLWAAYGDREAQLLDLDTLDGSPVTPARLLGGYAGDTARLAADFASWERWGATVLEVHRSYPMLAFFRSRRPGQSWLTAMGLLVETAGVTVACFCSPPPSADRLVRRALLALDHEAHGEHTVTLPDAREQFDTTYASLAAAGFELRPPEESWERLRAIRRLYGPPLLALAGRLLVPLEFRSSGPVDGPTSLTAGRVMDSRDGEERARHRPRRLRE